MKEVNVIGNDKITHPALKELRTVALVLVAALMSAIGMHVFVYPASFAPSGVDGIATMLYELTGVNAAYFILAINLPLLVAAWFILKKKYVVYTVLFTVVSSGLLILFETLSVPCFESVGEGLIPAIFSGILFGARTGIMLKLGASSGGIDVIACMVQKKLPHKNPESIITLICYGIILVSVLVYGDFICILLSVVQMFVFERVAFAVQKDNRNAIEVKIITKEPEAIRNDIIYNLKHGATILDSRGMYTDGESNVIISIINIRQLPEFLEIMKKHPDSFTYYGEVQGVKGNFRWHRDDEVK